MHTSHPRVLVLVDTSSGWGRRVIRGIANYGLKHGPWQLSVDERGINEPMHVKPGWQGDGIIARVSDQQLYTELLASGKPAVNVSGIILDGVDLPQVTTDYDAAAVLAVGHFTERGFRNLAYCGPEQLSYVQRHCEAFASLAQTRNLPCNVFRSTLVKGKQTWAAEREELLRWLQGMQKPVGILAWGTQRGREILNACTESGIPVPELVAVLAADDDDLLCEACYPPLSGIVTPAEQIGHEAARILDGLLRGESPPSESMLITPMSVDTRLSTDTLAITDPILIKAIQFIRENAHRPLRVADVAEAVQVSRRSLERRFETVIGRSPAKEIQHTHLERAKKLLRETNMGVADVAAASGYCSSEYMIGVFRKATGHTPLKYRTWTRAT